MSFGFNSPFGGAPGAPGTANATQQNKPTGFATPFGCTPTAFGQPTSGFGQQPARPTMFGQSTTSGFGQSPRPTTTTAGTAFGQATTSAFGQQQIGFGGFGGGAITSQAPPPGFGAGTTSGAGGGMFGTRPPSLFGGSTITTSVASSGLFGGGTSTTPSLFGTAQSSSIGGGGGLFGGTQATTLFATPTTNTTSSLFGMNATLPTFATNTTNNTSFGGGGFFQAPPPTFGSTAQKLEPTRSPVLMSVYSISVFNDERDDILKKWNMLQASWGTGRGWYHPSNPPIEYTAQNPFYRFRAMGYNMIPDQDNSDGVVKLQFQKKFQELRAQTEVLKNGLSGILGNRPQLTCEIIQIRAHTDTMTDVKIRVLERGVTGAERRIPANELCAYLNQPNQRQQLATVGVVSITALVTPTKAEIEEYLKQAPPFVDSHMFQAAIQDNPDPTKYLPVPINGFTDLRGRMLTQEHQTGLHRAFLEKVTSEVAEVKAKHAKALAQMAELKMRYMEFQHRVLRIVVKQESTRAQGIGIKPEEEQLRGRLEILFAQLRAPKQFKGQINELICRVKLAQEGRSNNPVRYRLDLDAQDEIKEFLKMEQEGIGRLVDVVTGDLKAMEIITNGLKDMLQRRGIVT